MTSRSRLQPATDPLDGYRVPEGAEVELHLVEDGEFEPEERARVIEAIEHAEAEVDRGEYMHGSAFIAQLRAKREAARR